MKPGCKLMHDFYVAFGSDGGRRESRSFEYPLLPRFCYTAEELHEVYGLSLTGLLHQQLPTIKDQDWLGVFKEVQTRGLKLYLNMLRPEFVDDCRLLFHKVYQGIPSNNEIPTKFAKCFVWERCPSAKENPAEHTIAWAQFGANVLRLIRTSQGNLDRKLDNWRKANGATGIDATATSLNKIRPGHGQAPVSMTQSVPKPRPSTQMHFLLPAHVNAIYERAKNVKEEKQAVVQRCKSVYDQKREDILRQEGASFAANKMIVELDALKTQLKELMQCPSPDILQVGRLQGRIESCEQAIGYCGVSADLCSLDTQAMTALEVSFSSRFSSLAIRVVHKHFVGLKHLLKANTALSTMSKIIPVGHNWFTSIFCMEIFFHCK